MNWGDCLFMMPIDGSCAGMFPLSDLGVLMRGLMSKSRGNGICAMVQIFSF